MSIDRETFENASEDELEKLSIFLRRENPVVHDGRESPHGGFTYSEAVLGADRRKTSQITPSQQGRTLTPTAG
ncbi:hypothetical protein BDK88_2070 [Natrinema hispanicum]|uniref:Uncharacterized protein n=1 Tax=Natrinema hispanicum TaxID=392421 RepID=A0A482Y9E2_9EURY|nr:hypothetical protein BDK88_2070 [Natrinema hispanicum]